MDWNKVEKEGTGISQQHTYKRETGIQPHLSKQANKTILVQKDTAFSSTRRVIFPVAKVMIKLSVYSAIQAKKIPK